MRRSRTLPLLAAVLLVAGSLLAGAWASGARGAASEFVYPAPLDRFAAAWAERDPAAIASLYAEDAVLAEAVIDGDRREGRAAIEEWLVANFAGFPDLALVPRAAFVSGDSAAIEWTYTGTYTGQIPGLPPGNGLQISIPGASVLHYRDGLIVQDTMYYDRATFEAQFMAGLSGASGEGDSEGEGEGEATPAP
ncbi:MAG: ester cyclase [Chloroflexota bacterium]